jgi:hypothetical protein
LVKPTISGEQPMTRTSTFARAAFAALSLGACASAWSGIDVGVGVTIREPGVYGRIEIGNGAPPPPVVYRRPVVIQQPVVVVAQPEPLYLYVPPGHARKWRKHCHRYDACGRQVYFVREEWVQAQYAQAHPQKGPPVYAQGRGHGHGHGHGKDKHGE